MSDPFEHGGNLYKIKRNSKQCQLLDFSANINPLGLSASVRQAIVAHIPAIIHYPDAEGYDLKQSIGKQYGLPIEKITLGNGAVELLYVLCHQLQPKKVLIPAPAFSEYERAARSVGAQIEYHFLSPDDGFRFDSQVFAKRLAGCDMVFIGNPNNPTGTLLTCEEIADILEAAAVSKTFVVIDESFIDFIADSEKYTAKSLLDRYDHLFVLHSLTKFYAIPGLRLGFAAANEALTAKLHLAKDPWNVNNLAQAAGIAALADENYQRLSRTYIAAESKNFYRELSKFEQFTIYQPTVNFALVDIKKTGFTAGRFKEICLREHILIRDCSNYPGLSDTYVRFAIKAAAENESLYQTLTKILGGEIK